MYRPCTQGVPPCTDRVPTVFNDRVPTWYTGGVPTVYRPHPGCPLPPSNKGGPATLVVVETPLAAGGRRHAVVVDVPAIAVAGSLAIPVVVVVAVDFSALLVVVVVVGCLAPLVVVVPVGCLAPLVVVVAVGFLAPLAVPGCSRERVAILHAPPVHTRVALADAALSMAVSLAAPSMAVSRAGLGDPRGWVASLVLRTRVVVLVVAVGHCQSCPSLVVVVGCPPLLVVR